MVSFDGLRLGDGGPIYQQIVRYLQRGLAAGTICAGDELPSRRVLSARLGVNPNTVQKAYSMLERYGLIHSLPGKGSFLSKPQAAVDKRRRDALDMADNAMREAISCGITRDELIELLSGLTYPEKEGNS